MPDSEVPVASCEKTNDSTAACAASRFAKYRGDAGGRFTERTLREYLVLASVFETCERDDVGKSVENGGAAGEDL